jgi:hypothetical protein
MPGGGQAVADASASTYSIPGPLRPFLRLAAISQKVSPDEVIPLLAHHVVMEGYGGQEKAHSPTEYLILLKRYIAQARELQQMAGLESVIKISQCSEAEPLLKVLGYKLRQPCGPDASLETADGKRAFITVDSGFPLVALENTLRGGKPFVYRYVSSQVPVLFTLNDWTVREKNTRDLLDALLGDPSLARLYWALARMDDATRTYLRQTPGIEKLVSLGAVLDFYGDQIHIQSGRVQLPGGARAESAWRQLVGASPDSPGEFVPKLLAKDEGWLAVYFDALCRVGEPQRTFFSDPKRMVSLYNALRGRDASPGPARPVFRPDPGLLLLMTRLQLDSNGQPHVPGNLDVWRDLLRAANDSKIARDWSKRSGRVNDSEDLLEALFAISRVSWGRGPLQIYLALGELDHARAPESPLSPPTVALLAKDYPRYSDQYLIFSEFHSLNDTSITQFLNIAEAIDRVGDNNLRAEAMGLYQANIGLWQILARQGQIPVANWNSSWQRIIQPFADVQSKPQLFDATRASLAELFRTAAGKSHLSQDEFILLLAGPVPNNPEGFQVREQLANQIRSVLDAQRLVSYDTLMGLGDGLAQMAQGKGKAETLLPLAEELREFEMPKPVFTTGERIDWASGPFGDPHTQAEMETNIAETIKSGVPRDVAAARGRLVPFLRDFLVGLNYAYYEPPGAQMMHNNPLLVRRHDFSGDITREADHPWRTPHMVGRGDTSGGGVHLAGGLPELPYVLGEVEQQFIVPENVQSLIWEDLVPCFLASAVVPRWWRVTRNELHAVTLYQDFGEELVAGAASHEDLRRQVSDILLDSLDPRRLDQVEQALRRGHSEEALAFLAPADTFHLAVEFRRKFPDQVNSWGKAGKELVDLTQRYPQEVNPGRLAEDFGVPHPAIAQTYARELLNVKPFPTFLGYSSRLLAESWQSNNLYWARLADERGLPPEMLSELVPHLTRRMVEKIFATHLDDWPALLRALRETGEEFRDGKSESLPKRAAAESQ